MSSSPVDEQTSPNPTGDGDHSPTPSIAVEPGHPADGNPTGEVKAKGKDGGRGNPRNKHVESLANTIAKFQFSQNGGAQPAEPNP